MELLLRNGEKLPDSKPYECLFYKTLDITYAILIPRRKVLDFI
jgi:hypothetical protein